MRPNNQSDGAEADPPIKNQQQRNAARGKNGCKLATVSRRTFEAYLIFTV
jgi:hypothetical protein